MKFGRIMLVLAVAFAVSTIAYAETQSVKLSGDLTMRALARHNMDLNNADNDTAVTGMESTNWATHLMSTAELQVDADLTDNVLACVRLLNQREWGDQRYASTTAGNQRELGVTGLPYNDVVAGRTIAPTTGDAFSVILDLAYVELKEFLYSPLTLRVGRQDLWFGKGFIVGANVDDPAGALYAMEYSASTAFDAVRATVDYDPWTIDGVIAKIRENNRRADDDLNLFGLNVGYVFDEYNAEAEGYWWFKQVRYTGAGGSIAATLPTRVDGSTDSNDVHTLGVRGSFDPIDDWSVALEGAYQFGKYLGVALATQERERSAFAMDAAVECRMFQDDYAWKPVLGAEYIYYSGQQDMGVAIMATEDTYRGWDPMFRGKYDTAIREFQNVYYRTDMASSPSNTNQHQILLTAAVEPTDSVTCDLTYGYFWLDQEWAGHAEAGLGIDENTKTGVGSEVDINLTWDYTEDVQLGLLSAWFFPGDHWPSGETASGDGNDVATSVVGTMKLSF